MISLKSERQDGQGGEEDLRDIVQEIYVGPYCQMVYAQIKILTGE